MTKKPKRTPKPPVSSQPPVRRNTGVQQSPEMRRWLSRRTEAFQNATTKKDGPGNKMQYPTPSPKKER